MSVSEYVPLSEDLKYTNGTADFFAIDLYTATKASAAILGQWCPLAASRSEASTGRGRRRHRERAGGGHARAWWEGESNDVERVVAHLQPDEAE